ncbi:uncharacterized protein LOC105841350 isoform X1 [Bombyx mori]|uniref:Cuticle protein n=1 Tax=Bombyx mori TaxID=7091 RepID=A0A8R2G781_BOMMO|nr:uncharacterized protein LOC105841350 isoform X1 [Bombyx mori]
MSPRVLGTTKWLWCFFVLQGSWVPARAVTVRTPPSNPATVEAQAKFFQDFFSVQLSPYKIEFGHVCEDPNTWEQRYEKKDFKNHRDMGKVRWGDKKGGYGEHYWDLNHAGHSGNNDNDGYENHSDDSPYGDNEHHDSYDEPSEQSPIYEKDEYDPEKVSYDESGRSKRAHPRAKVERRELTALPEKNKEISQEAAEQHDTPQRTDVEQKKPRRHQQQRRDNDSKETRNQVVLVVSHKDEEDVNEKPKRQPEFKAHFVPYEGGAGVRQHQPPEATAAASVPRLFLEPSTGHVVDRATGQAYVLQPVAN